MNNNPAEHAFSADDFNNYPFGLRVGTGYDVHRLVSNRKLMIGCVDIPYEFGLEGHSDADVLSHAIIDALFGAAGLSDIGTNFPDSDPKYSGVSGYELLKKSLVLVKKAGYSIVNIDSTVIAQQPKLCTYIPQMRLRISDALDISSDSISIKAKTEEGLGFIGASEGIASQAVVLLMHKL